MQRAFGYARFLAAPGTLVPNATVSVFNNGTLVLATIFADNLSTPKSNPFTSDQFGYWFFYAANGRVDVQISGVTGQAAYTLADYDLNDIFSLNGLTSSTQTLVVGNAGTDFAIVDTAPGTHTFNIPDAGAAARGFVTTGSQTFAGTKTFSTPIAPNSGGLGISTVPSNGFVPIGNGTNYTSALLTGTANQIVVTPGAGSITLSAPQSLGPGSSPTFASITDSLLAANQFGSVYISDTLGTFAVFAPLTNGQLSIGSTGLAPVNSTLTAGSNITITNGAGSITVAAPNVGITSLNGITSAAQPAQLFATSQTGVGFTVSSAGATHTFNLPDASATADGTVSTGIQTFAGQKTFSTAPQYNPGGSATAQTLSGLVTSSTASSGIAGNTSTAETTLATFSLPGATLNAAGKGIRMTAFFTLSGAGTQGKTARMYFGATVVAINTYTTGPTNNFIGIAQATIIEITGTTQLAFGQINSAVSGATALVTTSSSPAETLSGAVTLKFTGQVAGASTDTVTFNGWTIESLGA